MLLFQTVYLGVDIVPWSVFFLSLCFGGVELGTGCLPLAWNKQGLVLKALQPKLGPYPKLINVNCIDLNGLYIRPLALAKAQCWFPLYRSINWR